MILIASNYTNPRTGQTFPVAEITTGDLFVSEKLVTLNLHLRAKGGLDECFKLFWNDQPNDLIIVEREEGKEKITTFVKNLKEILPNDVVKSYGKMSITDMPNHYSFDGKIPFEFNPTTELGWNQLFTNVTFYGESLFEQFSTK